MKASCGNSRCPGTRGRTAVALLALTLLAGCASSRMIAAPTPPGPDLGLTAASDGLGLVLTHVIAPNGPGAWVKDAQWHEYAVTVRNLSDRPLTVERVRLIDPRGLYIDASVNPLQLERTSDTLATQYKDVAMAAAPGVVGASTLIGAGALISVMAPPAALVTLPAYGVYKVNKAHRTAEEHEQLERELARRQLPGFTLAGHATVSGSMFYPIVPNPRSLAVEYRVGREVKELLLPLATRSPEPPAERAGVAPAAPVPAGGALHEVPAEAVKVVPAEAVKETATGTAAAQGR